MQTITEYACLWNLRKRLGRVKPGWFDDAKVMRDHVRLFANEVSSVVRLNLALLLNVVQPTGLLAAEIASFQCLASILDL